MRSESLALGLLDETSIDGRIRGGRLPADEEAGAGDSGVEAFLVSLPAPSSLFPGEE